MKDDQNIELNLKANGDLEASGFPFNIISTRETTPDWDTQRDLRGTWRIDGRDSGGNQRVAITLTEGDEGSFGEFLAVEGSASQPRLFFVFDPETDSGMTFERAVER